METRICNSCKGDPQPIENFNWKNKAAGIRQRCCRTCKAAYQKRWYGKHKVEHRKNVVRNRQLNTAEVRRRLCEYLEAHPCVDCGERDIVVLQFDHVSGEKSMTISDMLRCDHTWKSILKEIAKCAVRCANCHVRKTAKQFGWYRLLVGAGNSTD